jgi:serine protease AprX
MAEGDGGFRRDMLDSSVISRPLLDKLGQGLGTGEVGGPRAVRHSPAPGIDLHGVVIDLHFSYPGGPVRAAERVRELIAAAIERAGTTADQGVDEAKAVVGGQYVVARLEAAVIKEVARLDRVGGASGRVAGEGQAAGHPRAVFRIWPDFKVGPLICVSGSTVKADAGRASFAATGRGVVWAILDSGVDATHPHFRLHDNLALRAPLEHRDFTGKDSPLTDEFGHGTHVAGILAGQFKGTKAKPIRAARRSRDENGDPILEPEQVTEMCGMAPQCRLVSYKVLDADGDGETSTIITALQEIQRVNNHGRDLKIHGVNLSVGYPFDPDWFACGQSPLCIEVNRLVASGVVVVVAAGNTGYVWNQDYFKGAVASGCDLTINDPGNAESVITVGATHRDSPHVYGVSYFSSKGPTGDGREKPDLVAPGERILSCAAGKSRTGEGTGTGAGGGAVTAAAWDYVEDSGTSMAAPHVSGVIAAFLSVRKEFIGRPDEVKKIFLSTATDLGRVKEFQGRGLVDLMRAIQSV